MVEDVLVENFRLKVSRLRHLVPVCQQLSQLKFDERKIKFSFMCGKIGFLPDRLTLDRLNDGAPIYVGHKLATSTLSAYICFEG